MRISDWSSDVCPSDLPGRPIVCDPARIEEADLLVIESTYGDRTHSDPAGVEEELVAVIEQTLHQRGGNVIIPAFAVGRTQQLIYQIHPPAAQGPTEHPTAFPAYQLATEVNPK